ncbi:regulator [Paenibacillus sp. 32O-W]|uniref:response regulator n=1 Tax=Paenibacillus sp. 32O-W TaxID=1695218 RepID=UPI00071F6D5B|nr:response regulator transcription factor [Paenibacillus sp. 32O-W]ALS28890.1 regulator [Paenibacillus sp. 32O-W]
MDQIKVMLVEDDAVWRDQLTSFLSREHDLVVVGSAANREDAVHLARLSDAQVVLMDLVLSDAGFDGLEAAMDILEMKQTKIIMLTGVDEEDAILDTYAAGAVNYVTKAHFEDIPCAIRAAYNNLNYIHPDSAGVLVKEFRRMKREQRSKQLTSAEQEILRFIHKGYKQSNIQSKLHATESTIKKHVNRILKKLGTSSSSEAARKAKRLGIID